MTFNPQYELSDAKGALSQMTSQEYHNASDWRMIVDHLPCGIIILNKNGAIEYTNSFLEQALGNPEKGLVGKHVGTLLHPEDKQAISEMLLAENPQKTVSRIRHQDKSWHRFEINSIKLPTKSTSADRLILSLREITAKQHAERVLKRRNLELALLNQAGRAFSATLDLDKVLATVLEEVRRLMGVVACSIWLVDKETDELVCQQATGSKKELVQGWRLPKGEGLVGLVAATGRSLNIDNVLEDEQHFAGVDEKTGLALRSILSVPLKVKKEVIGVIQALDTQVNRFTNSDKVLLEALGTSAATAIDNARLVETLRRRTADLKASNQELEAFAHTVAHDLKAPLTHVIGYADVLIEYEDSLDENNRQEYIQAIHRSGHKMNNIIDELLLLSELRKEEVTLSPLDMERIVEEALDRLQPMCEQKRAEIQIMDEWPKALGYSPWVEEVWVNYISNALKYGGDIPRIKLGGQANDTSVSFWVRDNGVGLTPNEQKQLFVPFTHVGEADTKGYGLGLSIVHRIIDKLNGEVWVESTKGKGSTFGFTLQKDSNNCPD